MGNEVEIEVNGMKFFFFNFENHINLHLKLLFQAVISVFAGCTKTVRVKAYLKGKNIQGISKIWVSISVVGAFL